jgi:hypothetical protein
LYGADEEIACVELDDCTCDAEDEGNEFAEDDIACDDEEEDDDEQ